MMQGTAPSATHITIGICPCGCKNLLLVHFDSNMKPLSAFKTTNESMLSILTDLKQAAITLSHSGPPQ